MQKFRGTGSLVTALVVSALYIASGLVNWFLVSQIASGHRELVDLVFPSTFSWAFRYGGAGMLVAVLSTVFVAASVALVVRRMSRPGHPGIFAAVWLSVAIVSLAVTALRVIGNVLHGVSIGPVPGVYPERLLSEILQGGYFGLLLGWIPALVARALSRARAEEAHSEPAPVVLKATLIGVVVCGLALTAAAFSASSIAWSDAHPVVPEGTPSASPSITALPIPTPTVTPIPAPLPDASRCTLSQGAITIGPIDAALGHRAVSITIRNAGQTTCDAYGYASVSFFDGNGDPATVRVSPGVSYMAQDPGVVKVSLTPGESAVAVLSWRSSGRSGADGTVRGLRIAPSAESAGGASLLPIRMDLSIDGEATLTAWHQPK